MGLILPIPLDCANPIALHLPGQPRLDSPLNIADRHNLPFLWIIFILLNNCVLIHLTLWLLFRSKLLMKKNVVVRKKTPQNWAQHVIISILMDLLFVCKKKYDVIMMSKYKSLTRSFYEKIKLECILMKILKVQLIRCQNEQPIHSL